jgi:hypothetical protein
LRLGIHVSLEVRQAVRSVGVALELDPIALNSPARQVPLLSSPGAIGNVPNARKPVHEVFGLVSRSAP